MEHIKKLTRKQQEYVQAYVGNDKETRLNGTKSALKAYNVKKNTTASSISTENLTKPLVRESIERALENSGLTDDVVTTIHTRNMKQSKHLSVSQQAVRDYYKLKYGNNTQGSKLNVAFVIK